MVIQCPECGTKFSVESDELDGARSVSAANPIFHCSRCNHLFDLRGKRKPLARESLPDRVPDGATESPAAESEELAVNTKNPSKDSKQLELLSGESAEGTGSYEWNRKSSLLADDDDSRLPLITAEWPDRPDREMEVNLGEIARKTTPYSRTLVDGPPETRHEFEPVESLPQPKPFVPATTVSTSSLPAAPLANEYSLADQFPSQISVPSQISPQRVPTSLAMDPITERSAPARETAKEVTMDIPPTFLRTPSSSRPDSAPKRTIPPIETQSNARQIPGGTILHFPPNSRILSDLPAAARIAMPAMPTRTEAISWTKSLGTGLAGPLAMLVLFWAIAWYGTGLTAPLMSIASSGLPRVSPDGIEIQAPRSSVKVLNDGQKVVEVLGNVVNATPKTFKNVFVVVRAFNDKNQKLGEQIVPAVNGLQNVDAVGTLRSDMVQRLQLEAGVSKPLKPTQAIPFRAVLLADGEVPSYFDARVYSVERSQS